MPSNQRTRRRKLSGPKLSGQALATSKSDGSVIASDSLPGKRLEGIQVTVSEGHQWPAPPGAKLTDRGGAFYTTRSYLASPRVLPYTSLFKESATTKNSYKGTLVPSFPALSSTSWNPSFFYPPTLESSDSVLDAKGAKAISLCKPTSPQTDLGVAFAELFREGLPGIPLINSLKQATGSVVKRGSGEFLNYVFGIKPIVSSVQDTVKTLRRADQLLEQYVRDSGRVVRRKFRFSPEISESETVMYTNSYPLLFGVLSVLRPGYNGKCVRHRKVERNVWFSGAFTYFLPDALTDGWDVNKFSEKADILLGTDITPETLWNIGPWSWLTDWVLNTGDVISNLLDFGSGELVMRYGYVMETTTVTDTYTHYPVGPFSGPPGNVTELVFVTETKKRRPANPFGFGVTYEGLSPMQGAILAALGFSRGS